MDIRKYVSGTGSGRCCYLLFLSHKRRKQVAKFLTSTRFHALLKEANEDFPDLILQVKRVYLDLFPFISFEKKVSVEKVLYQSCGIIFDIPGHYKIPDCYMENLHLRLEYALYYF